IFEIVEKEGKANCATVLKWPLQRWPSPDASGNPCKIHSLGSCQGFGYWSDSGRAQNSADAAVGEQDCSGQREIAPYKILIYF
ncbi:MAG: hypothetical protein Q4F57_09735, partial [Weeksellaceae bacterium]|nr:hypothetical protein [Weeksellaceae bacterium]